MPFLTPELPDLGVYQKFIEFWQRLEPQCRSDDITRSLQAQVRDPAWMLTRQWQMGEFAAEDAGSPIKTSLMTTKTKITRYHCSGMPSPFIEVPKEKPLEALVEQESVITVENSWRFRIQAGQRFAREIRKKLTPESAEKILSLLKNPTIAGIKPTELDDSHLDSRSRAFLLTIVGLKPPSDEECRTLNGAVLLSMTEPQLSAILGSEYENDGTKQEILDAILEAIERLKTWAENLFSRPSDENCKTWQSKRMEYEFSVSAPEVTGEVKGQKVLVSREYDGSDLDWFDFSLHPSREYTLGDPELENEEEADFPESTSEPIESIPTNLTFYGCPNHRFWRFEDAKTDFGALTLDKVDLSKLLVMDFALIQSNDWFVIPYEMEIGSFCRIDSLTVTDVFGEEKSIRPAKAVGRGIGWNPWDIFSISVEPDKSATEVNLYSSLKTDAFIFIPPSLGSKDENFSVEEVRFLRDEIANMVWGVEFMIQNNLGEPVSGYEAYRDRLAKAREDVFRTAVAKLNDKAKGIIGPTEDSLKQQITEIANQNNLTAITDIIEDSSLYKILEKAKELVEQGELEELENTAALKIIQLLEESPLGKIWAICSRTIKVADYMNLVIAREAVTSLATEIIESMIDLPIPEGEAADLIAKIVDAIAEAKSYAQILRMKEFVDDIGQALYYRLASVVPENWIPYIAVRQEAEDRQICLKQARMLSTYTFEPNVPVTPKTLLLNSSEVVNEEAVSRAGIQVKLNFQRARWINGSTHLWVGRSVGPSRGEGYSGLRFDYIDDKRI